MKQKLYLGTVQFPYGNGEKSFIEPEIKYLTEKYDVTIISCPTDENYEKYQKETKKYEDISFLRYRPKKEWLTAPIYLIQAMFDQRFWKEIGEIIHKKTSIGIRCYAAFRFYMRGCAYRDFLKNNVSFEPESFYYSYWNNDLCFGAILYNEKYKAFKILTRLHGHDLYNERFQGGRQPFKTYMDRKLDAVVFACQYGLDYYTDTFSDGKKKEKYYLCRLGSRRQTRKPCERGADTFTMVSCARTIELKRIDKIIDALSLIEDIPIHWIHFGGDDVYEDLVRRAHEKLDDKKNICYEMPGAVANQEVRAYYQSHPVDCFITTSASEGGCPMAIQEAMLFEIPILATKVGGITEMIKENGILMDENPSAQQVRDAILMFWNMGEKRRTEMGKQSYRIWCEMFDIENNGKRMTDIIDHVWKS